MFIDRFTESLPGWLALPLSVLSSLAALAGSGCLFAAAVFGSFGWSYFGLGSFAVAALLWQAADRISVAG